MQRRLDLQCAADDSGCSTFDVRASLQYNRSYGPSDFESESNSFRGNAFGLANTLLQSLVLKPTIDSRVANMVFAGHLTNPGPGIPPSLVSGIQAALVLDRKMAEISAVGEGRVPGASLVWKAATAVLGASLRQWLIWLIAGIMVFRWVLVPVIVAIASIGLELLLPSTGTTLTEKQLRFRSYFLATEYMYRHGKTYFGAACLMSPVSFFNTAAMYSLFRVVDDFVDNDDPRLRVAELDEEGVRIDPVRYRVGANARRAQTSAFVASFWDCWEACTAPIMPAGSAMSVSELYRVHPIMPAVMETALRAGYDRSLFERFFSAMLMDTRAMTMLPPADVAAMAAAGLLPEGANEGTRYSYLGNVCRNTDEILKYMDGSAAVIGDFMLPVLVPSPPGLSKIPRSAILAPV